MNLDYKVRRLRVEWRARAREKDYKKAISELTLEQKDIFDIIEGLSKSTPSCIKFDPEVDKSMLEAPNVLITLRSPKVFVLNSHGFHTEVFSKDTFDVLESIVKREAHRDRRKLEREGRNRVRAFLANTKEELSVVPS